MAMPEQETVNSVLDKAVRAGLAKRMGAIMARVVAVGRQGQDYRVTPLYSADGGTAAIEVPCVAGLWPQVDDVVWLSVNHRAFRQDTLQRLPGRYSWQSVMITSIVRPWRNPHHVPADRIEVEGSVLKFDLRDSHPAFEPVDGWHWTFQAPSVVSNAELELTTLNEDGTDHVIEAAPIYTTQDDTPAGFSEKGVYNVLYAIDHEEQEAWRKVL